MICRKTYRKYLLVLLGISLLVLGVYDYFRERALIPDSYTQTEGGAGPETPGFPVTAQIQESVTKASYDSRNGSSYRISYRYLGVIPLKETNVQVTPKTTVTPGGIPIGIYMETDGVMVIGTGKVTGRDGLNYEPAFRLVQAGDYIRSVNGVEIREKEKLIESVEENGSEKLVLGIERSGRTFEIRLQAADTENGYRLGIWVRDNTQGIGTLTFLTENGKFGALGHGINDSDTGELLKISEGKLYDTTVAEIHRGEPGNPGQVAGLIRYRNNLICGQIQENTEAGIFGEGTERLGDKLDGEAVEVGYKQEITEGEAWVRSGINGEMRDYRIAIEEVKKNASDVNKGMILRVTDPELLALTGGIIQGMSGSPIIQNGKLIGAVTHVFVNDPTKGYGIFVEEMLSHVS